MQKPKITLQSISELADKKYKDKLISAFYTKEHLLNHIEEQYSDFIQSFLPQFFNQKSPLFLSRALDKTKQVYKNYYLKFGRFYFSDIKYADSNRNIRSLDNEACYTHKYTKEIKLFVEVSLHSRTLNSEGIEEAQVEQCAKKFYNLGRLPLLVNSRYDLTPENKSTNNIYYFIFRGCAKLLYNLVQNQPFQKSYKQTKDGLKLIIGMDMDSNTPPLYLEKNNTKEEFTIQLNRYKGPIPLFKLFKILEVPLEKLIDLLNKEQVISPGLLSMIEKGYNSEKEQILREFWSNLKGIRSENSTAELDFIQQEVLEKTVDSLPKTPSAVNGVMPDSQILRLKKNELIQIIVQFLKIHEKKKQIPFADSTENKVVYGVNVHFQRAFQQGFKDLVEKAKVNFLRQITSILKHKSLSHLLRVETISNAFKSYMSQKKEGKVQNYNQAINPTNLHTLISDSRKVVSTLNKSLLHVTYRSSNPLKHGRLCPVHTPYSRSVGLVEYLSLGTKVSDTVHLPKKYLRKLTPEDQEDSLKVYWDERLLGYLAKKELSSLIKKLQAFKRRNLLSYNLKDVTSKQNRSSLEIRGNKGRMLKPVLNPQLLHKLDLLDKKDFTLQKLCSEGIICYIDGKQQLHSLIASTPEDLEPETQYLYLDPSVYFSYMATSLPEVNTNAAHRASLSVRLVSQAIGANIDKEYGLNNTKQQYLLSTHPSLMTTYFDINKITSDQLGQNAIVAFEAKQNEEDSVSGNLSAIQRGLFEHKVKRKQRETSKYDPLIDNYEHIPNVVGQNQILQEDGLCKVGDLIQNENLFFEYKKQNETILQKRKLKSPISEYRVSRIKIDTNLKKSCQIEVSLEKLRKLTVGNKIGTRSGLKGVISKLIPENQLNFTKSGTNAALFFSNNCITSRMTLGPLWQIYYTKYLAYTGQRSINSIFTTEAQKNQQLLEVKEYFINRALNKDGKESQIKPGGFNTDIYMGPMKVLLLAHYSLDKFYTRGGVGGKSFLTRQPGQGRNVRGGLRIGEMQCNSLIEHTAINFIKDKLGIDLQQVQVCKSCNVLTDQLVAKQKTCNNCGSTDLAKIQLPYAFILLSKVLKAGHIETKFNTISKHKSETETETDSTSENLKSTQHNNSTDKTTK